MKKLYSSLFFLFLIFTGAFAQVDITTSTYTQNFNTLNEGTSAVVPTGWAFVESGIGVDGNYLANNGSNSFPNTFKYRTNVLPAEGAFGMLRQTIFTTEFFSIIGASFRNTTGATIEALQIAYIGEMWRLGTTGNQDSLNFQYSLDATSINDAGATWIEFDPLDFGTPNNTGLPGQRIGNNTPNRTNLAGEITGLSIPDNGIFFIRWLDVDIAAAGEDGLAIDDFSLTAIIPPPTEVFISNVTPTSVDEVNASTTVTVSINNPSSTNATQVDLVFTGGTVTNGTGEDIDYTTQTVVFPAGSSADQDVTITMNDDSDVEGDETMTFELQMVSGGTPTAVAIDPTDVTITIVDDDFFPTEVFISAATPTSVDENAFATIVTVSINNPSATAATQVDLVFTGGTVTNGPGGDIDYTTQTITFPAGSSADNGAFIFINDDTEVEGDETMTFELQNVMGGNPTAVVVPPTDVTITIIDDDVAPVILHYRSVASGSWFDLNTWETSVDGNAPWTTPAVVAPSFLDGPI